MASGANDFNKVTLPNASRSTSGFDNDPASAPAGATSRVNELLGRGAQALRGQYQVVREQGVQGVTNDVVGYAKREPMKALLLAGGIGALATMILRRR
jgi:hypothetical protein